VSDDWWTDYRQNRRIEELRGEVEAAYGYAASRSRALQSRLADVQGSLERRLDRLARSFDAFVELSDLRLELAVFDREALVRHRTRRLIMGLAGGAADPPPLGVEDCPGYWLGPAADALSALVRGDAAAADKHTAVAIERDEDRTTMFLTLGLATAGRYAEAVPWLARALPALGTTVTTVQRRLWIACADGAFGEPGREHIERRLTEVLDELPAEVAERQRERWRQTAVGPAGTTRSRLPRELQDQPAVTEPPPMAGRLAALRARVEAAVRPVDTAPAADLGDPLTALVDEGAPEERTLVARARELRQIIEMGGVEQPVAWDAPAGETLDLLHRDVFERSAPGPRALAVRVGGDWIRSVADDLARRATARPPDTVDVRLYGRPVRICPNGSADLAGAQADIARAAEPGPLAGRLGMALTAAGVALMVLAVLTGLTGLGVVAAVVGLVGAGVWINFRVGRDGARRGARYDGERLALQTETIARALAESHDVHRKLLVTAEADRQAIVTVLT
jgi:hypothetical protein